jgi:hypothetical protein
MLPHIGIFDSEKVDQDGLRGFLWTDFPISLWGRGANNSGGGERGGAWCKLQHGSLNR